MTHYAVRETFADLTGVLLECARALEKLQRSHVVEETGRDELGLYDALEIVTGELASWGIDSPGVFRIDPDVQAICREIICELDGMSPTSEPEPCPDAIYERSREEYQNLLKILSRHGEGDPGRAHEFCLAAHRRAVATAEAASYRV